MNKTKAIVALIILGVLVWVIKSTGNNQVSPGQTIKIGVVAPLTGGASGYGLSLIKGLELAMQDIGSTTKNKYELIFEDDTSNVAQSANATQKLVNVDKVSAVITTTSGTGHAAAPITTAAGVPHVCVCVDTSITDNKLNFIYLILPQVESKVWVDEAKSQGVKKVALVSQNHPGFNLIIEAIKPMLTDAGISIAYEDKFDPTTKDFKTIIAKAKATNPDLYLLGGFPPGIDVAAKEFRNQKVTNFAGMGTFAISPDTSVYEGNWFSDVNLTDMAFKERFEKAFPQVRFNARTAPEAYDVITMIVKGFESGRPVGEYLSALDSYDGKVGHVTKVSGTGNFSVSGGIWKIQNGKAVQVK